MNTKQKVMVGSTGGGIGVAVAVIIAWILSEMGVAMPVEVQAALGGVLVWGFERLGGWFNRSAQ